MVYSISQLRKVDQMPSSQTCWKRCMRSSTLKLVTLIVTTLAMPFLLYTFVNSIDIWIAATCSSPSLHLECETSELIYHERDLELVHISYKNFARMDAPIKVECAGIHQKGFGGNGTCYKQTVRFLVRKRTEHIETGPCGQEVFAKKIDHIVKIREYEYQCGPLTPARKEALVVHLPRVILNKVVHASKHSDPPQEYPGYLKCLAHTYFGFKV